MWQLPRQVKIHDWRGKPPNTSFPVRTSLPAEPKVYYSPRIELQNINRAKLCSPSIVSKSGRNQLAAQCIERYYKIQPFLYWTEGLAPTAIKIQPTEPNHQAIPCHWQSLNYGNAEYFFSRSVKCLPTLQIVRHLFLTSVQQHVPSTDKLKGLWQSCGYIIKQTRSVLWV